MLDLALAAQVLQRAEHLGERRGVRGPGLAVEQPQVDERQPLHAERAEVVLDARAQLLGAQRGQPRPPVVAPRADLRHETQPVGVRVQRLADERVDDVGAVVLRRVDVVDAELDGPAQDGQRGVAVARRAEHAGAGELHRAEADPADVVVAELGGAGHGHATTVRYRRRGHKKGIDRGTRTTTLRGAPLGAHRLPPDPARPGHAAGRRPPRRRPAPHARPAPRGGRAARRGRPVLVHVARAGPRHQAVGAGARRAGPGPAPRPGRARAPVPPRARRAAAARPRTTRARRRPSWPPSSRRSSRSRPTCSARAPTSSRGTPPPPRCSASRRARPTDGRTSCGGSSRPASPRTEQRRATARTTLARFRAEHARRIGDPDFAALVAALEAGQRAVPRLVAAPRGAGRAARDEDGRAPARSVASCSTTCSRRRRATPTSASSSSCRPTRRPARRSRGSSADAGRPSGRQRGRSARPTRATAPSRRSPARPRGTTAAPRGSRPGDTAGAPPSPGSACRRRIPAPRRRASSMARVQQRGAGAAPSQPRADVHAAQLRDAGCDLAGRRRRPPGRAPENATRRAPRGGP